MDAAIAELRYTIEQALEYIRCDHHHLEELQSHVEALKEDIGIVEQQKTGDKSHDKDADDVVRQARRMKRDVDKLYFPLLRQREAAKQQIRKEELDVQKQTELALIAAAEKQTTTKKASSVKMPTIKLPIFSGEVEQWRGFKQMLTELTNEDPDMATTKKWLLLKEHLGGKALEIVQELPTSPETYTVAMDLLEQAYGSVNKAVTTLYHRLQNLPKATASSESLRLTYARIDGMLRSLELLGEDTETNRFLRTVVVGKFPKEVFLHLRVNDEMDLAKFRRKLSAYITANENSLEMFVENRQTVTCNKEPNKFNRFRGKGNNEKVPHQTENDKKESCSSTVTESQPATKKARPRKCAFCCAEHYSDQCDAFPTLEQRKRQLGERCGKCFQAPHPGKDCSRAIKCAHCDEFTHNRALCPKKLGTTERACPIRDQEITNRLPATSSAAVTEEVANAGYVTLMVDAYRSTVEQEKVQTRAVVDTASRRTLIKRSLVKRLKLKENKNIAVQLYGVTNVSASETPSSTCRVYLRPNNHRPVAIDAVVVDDIIDDITAPSVAEFRRRYPQFNQLSMPDEGNGCDVELLIGTRSLVSLLTLQNSVTVSPSIQLLSTKFGWVILGGFEGPENKEDSSIATMIVQSYDPVQLMCELDTVGLKGLENTQNEEEAIALEKFYETLEFLEDEKRYQMGLPYRYDPPDLEDNFGLAWGRLQSLYKKLKTSPELLQAYDEQIKQQEISGVVEKLNENPKKNQPVHYIAHQVVVRMEKSTPVRVVLDASAHTAGKRSLNDNILKGANWVDDMPSLLMRFRKGEIATTADVSKAFHQLSIRPSDRDLCRFLWLKDISKPPSKENLQIYRFRRVAFGIASSPFLLYATIKYHIRKYPHEYTDVLENDFYADNLVTSFSKDTAVKEFYEKVKSSFNTMSMNLTKWTSSSEEMRASIPKEDRDETVHQSVLGMYWHVKRDEMGLQAKPSAFGTQIKVTKRRILKETATIFDPLGWAMPIVLLARIFIRKVWKQGFSWDEQLPQEFVNEWLSIRKNLSAVENVKLNRKMFTCPSANDTKKWELHVFSDASIEAYAAVVFIKSGNQLAFVAAKARLSPKNKISVPRLELIGAVIAARYAAYVKRALKIKSGLRVTLWTDSKCILAWLNTTKILPAYVQKSVAEIRSLQISSYKYVPSEKNPADVATRGSDFETLQAMEWWNGPQWLRDEKQWPKQDALRESLADNIALKLNKENKTLLMKINITLKKFDPRAYTNTPFSLDPKKFTTIEALLKRSGYVLEAVNRIFTARLKYKVAPVKDERTNFNHVRRVWLRWDQERAYGEIPISRKPNVAYLRNISVIKDDTGLIRCVTRLQNSGKKQETVTPILLVKDSPITELIVMSAHLNNLHAGTPHTLASIRRAYWLPHGRQQVYKIIKKNCAICKKHSAKPFALPEMAPLPEFRIQPTENPFRNTGLDVFGPITTKIPSQQNARTKKWVVIFTCMIVRAIHLEVLDDMTSAEFLEAFRRFTARRGTPEIVVSDNAPQFTVVERRFVSVWHYISEKEDIVNYFSKKQIKWKFIPPYSPWMGGVYERLIKSVKIALEKTHPTVIMTEKQFATVIVEVEGMLNSRPISYVDKNIDSPIITPNHFLSTKYPAIAVNFENQPVDQITQLWKAAEEYLNAYWKIWSEQYVLSLAERINDINNPHLVTRMQPKVGEIVLMIDPMKKRSAWRKALVERLIESKDSKIRAVQIKLANGGRMIRPINKLLPLGLITDLPDVARMQLNEAGSGLVHSVGESVEDENS